MACQMFISVQIIYLHLQKTGGTHVTELLTKYLGGTITHKHGRLDCAPAGRTVIGSIRNPWDWYVSLFAYGCMGEGAIEGRLTAGRGGLALATLRRAARRPASWSGLPTIVARQTVGHDTRFWRRVYADASDIGAFREWLYAILGTRVQNMVFEDPRTMRLHRFVGLYTARAVYLYSDRDAWDAKAKKISNFSDLADFYRAQTVLDRTIRTESIAGDLAVVMAGLGRPEITETMLKQHGKTNASKRTSFERYYNAETIAFVADRDRLIIDSFGYTAPLVIS
jgi:hypothetical protein